MPPRKAIRYSINTYPIGDSPLWDRRGAASLRRRNRAEITPPLPSPPLLLFVDLTEARRAEKKFETGPPSLSQGLDDLPPPPPPLYLKVWIHLCSVNMVGLNQQQTTTKLYK